MASTNLNIMLYQSKGYMTRSRARAIRGTFRFLDLPAELRNMVYEYAIDLKGIEKYFDKYWTRLRDRGNKKADVVRAPRHHRKCPTILLICKQIYEEAAFYIPKKEVNFHHGMLDLERITDIVSRKILQTVSSITISTHGHQLLYKNLLKVSWTGYLEILQQLSEILGEKHNLKELNIHLDDEDLKWHLYTCWHRQPGRCGFKDQMVDALEHLRFLRGIRKVTITGIPDFYVQELKGLMERQPPKFWSFLGFPREIRDMIYALAADYNDVSIALAKTMKDWFNRQSTDAPYPYVSTPTILLLNRQVYHEAITEIRKRPLKLTFPTEPQAVFTTTANIPNILNFITPNTLMQVTNLHIYIDNWVWIHSLEHTFPYLAASTALKKFRFEYHDHLKQAFMHYNKKYPDKALHAVLSGLATIRGLEAVKFVGDLPEEWTEPMRFIMRSQRDAEALPKMMAVTGDGGLVDVDVEGE